MPIDQLLHCDGELFGSSLDLGLVGVVDRALKDQGQYAAEQAAEAGWVVSGDGLEVSDEAAIGAGSTGFNLGVADFITDVMAGDDESFLEDIGGFVESATRSARTTWHAVANRFFTVIIDH
jgi:hypothetical protein